MKLRRETVRKFWCPACGAAPGTSCVIEGIGEQRRTLHLARIEKAERVIEASLRAAGKLDS